jgi:hypothetical protein
MANFMTSSAPHSVRKSTSRHVGKAQNASTRAQARANEEMHDEIGTRACAVPDLSKMTRFDRSMTREEIIAKVMGKTVEEVAIL